MRLLYLAWFWSAVALCLVSNVAADCTFAVLPPPAQKIDKFFLRRSVSTATDCAALCFQHPFCVTAGFTPGDANTNVCLFSYYRPSCEGAAVVTNIKEKAASVLISCISCGETAAVIKQGETAAEPIGKGGATVLLDQNQYPPFAFDVTDKEVFKGNCLYVRATGVMPKKILEERSPTSFPNFVGRITATNSSVGRSSLNESKCAELCLLNEYCDEAAYAESDGTSSDKPGAVCLLLGGKSQLRYLDLPANGVSKHGFKNIALLYPEECDGAHSIFNETCSFSFQRYTSVGSLELAKLDFVSSKQMDQCVALCTLSLTCVAPLYDYNAARCYFLNDNQTNTMSALPGKTAAVNETGAVVDTDNFYLFNNVSCDDEYLRYIPVPKKSRDPYVCNEDGKRNVGILSNVVPKEVLRQPGFYPKATAVYRTARSAEECWYNCLTDMRCETFLHAENADAEQKLASALNLTGNVKCAMFGYTTVVVRGDDVEVALPITVESTSEQNTGVTQYFNLTDCAEIRDRQLPCSAAQSFKADVIPPQDSEITIVFNVNGITECDMACANMNDCVGAAFRSVEEQSDTCTLFTSAAQFKQDDAGAVVVRIGIKCPRTGQGFSLEEGVQSKEVIGLLSVVPARGNLTENNVQSNATSAQPTANQTKGVELLFKTVISNGCTSKQYTGVLPKQPDLAGLLQGLAHSTNRSELDVDKCIRLCFGHPYCNQALFSEETKMINGTETVDINCRMFAREVQLYTPSGAADNQTSNAVWITDMKCDNLKNPGCQYEFKRVTEVGSFDLGSVDVVVFGGFDFCAAQCLIATNCNTTLYDLNQNLCYLLTSKQATAIDLSKNSPVVDSRSTEYSPKNYYVISNIQCDPAFTHNIPRATPGLNCSVVGSNKATAATIENVDIYQIFTNASSNGLHPRHIAAYRSIQSADECQYACLGDPRCEVAFFAGDEIAAKNLTAAANISGNAKAAVKCLLFGYVGILPSDTTVDTVPPGIVSAESPTGITMIYDLDGCGPARDPEPLCEGRSVIVGKVPSSLTDPAATYQVYSVSGPSECDHLCAQLAGCQSVAFESSKALPTDRCHVITKPDFFGQMDKNDKQFESVTPADQMGLLRSDLQCTKIRRQ